MNLHLLQKLQRASTVIYLSYSKICNDKMLIIYSLTIRQLHCKVLQFWSSFDYNHSRRLLRISSLNVKSLRKVLSSNFIDSEVVDPRLSWYLSIPLSKSFSLNLTYSGNFIDSEFARILLSWCLDIPLCMSFSLDPTYFASSRLTREVFSFRCSGVWYCGIFSYIYQNESPHIFILYKTCQIW